MHIFGLKLTFIGSLKVCIDKAVQISIHHSVHVAVFKVCAVVFYQCIRHKYVAADLAAPSNGVLYALDVADFIQMLTLFNLYQLGSKHFHTHFAVLQLAALVLAVYHNTGGLVDKAHGAAGFIDMLAACAGRAVYFHFNIGGVDVHTHIIT